MTTTTLPLALPPRSLPHNVLLEHKGRRVYRVERDPYDDEKPGFCQFWFTFVNGEWFGPTTFDVRRLPTWQGHGNTDALAGFGVFTGEWAEIDRTIRAAIDEGYLP
jgi:hypothetical protein